MSSIVYLLQVSACTGVFFLFYYLVLSRLTFFTANRWYLIITLVLSFIIPVLRMPLDPQEKYIPVIQQVVYINTLQYSSPVLLHAAKSTTIVSHSINWLLILKETYVLAVVGLTCHLLITLLLFVRRLKSSTSIRLEEAIILKGTKTVNNGSFLNYIFLNDEQLSADEKQQVIDHELIHVKLYHSIDRIMVKLAQIILWFNPFIYLYAKAIEVNHEFEVDRKMASSTNKNTYANLLLQLAVSGPGMLSNNFSKAPLKKRITMLFNKPSANMKKAIYLLIVPVVLISCLAFSKLKSIDAIKNHFSRELLDSVKYRQKVKHSKKELTEQEKFKAYRQTDDFKRKEKALADIWGKEISVNIKDIVKDNKNGKQVGFNFNYDNNVYQLTSRYGQEKQLNDLLKAGDKITMRVFSGGFSMKDHTLMVSAAYVVKDKIKIFQLAEADKLPNYPFLYEENKVRFAEGQVSNIVRYPNGKWKTALFETVNGYKFNLSFKQNTPDDLKLFEWGDHVTLRFVHETKTGPKTYKVDWVSISRHDKTYGAKNPDLFNKFYTAI